MTALEELKKFCKDKSITVSLVEDKPKEDKDSLITLPSVKLIVLYKNKNDTKKHK